MQKTNFKTRLLALLTAVFMVIMCVPFAAFAADEGGTGAIPNEIDVYFNAFDGMDGLNLQGDGADYPSAGVAHYVLNSTSGDKALPTITNVPEDKEFKGWFIDDFEVVANNFATLASKANNGCVTVTAVFTDKVVEPETTPIEVSFYDGFGHLIKTETLKETTASVEEPAATSVEYNTDKYEFHGDWANTFNDPVETNMVRSFDYNTLKFFATTDDKGVAHVYLYPVLTKKEPETPELKTINVYFINPAVTAGDNSVADMVTVTADKAAAFPLKASNMGENDVLKGWNGDGFDALFDAGQSVNFTDLSKYVAATSISKDGVACLNFVPVIATEKPSKPVAADVNKIYVHFNDEIGLYKTDIVYIDHGYITAPATDMSVSEYDYTWNNDEGLIFNVGDVIKFADVISHAGAFAREDEKTVSAHISFTKTAKKEAPAEAVVRNVIFQLSQVEGAKWATEDEQKAYGKDDRKYQTWSTDSGKYVAPAAAKDGKDFDYWVCNYGDKKIVIRAGEEFNFNTLTAKGIISTTEAGDFAFNPVFKDKASSSSSSASSSSSSSSSSSNTTNTSASNTTTTSASQKQVVKPAAAPANTTKVLPKTGATNAAPLIGGSLAVVALLMGYGVYGLVLRKKD